jgi:hypothetical protein
MLKNFITPPAWLSLTKLYLAGNNLIIPGNNLIIPGLEEFG